MNGSDLAAHLPGVVWLVCCSSAVFRTVRYDIRGVCCRCAGLWLVCMMVGLVCVRGVHSKGHTSG